MEMNTTWTSLKVQLSLIAKLGRLRMTIFSAVTYSVAFSIALPHDPSKQFPYFIFLSGWLFTLCCQLSAHFLGEYYDFKSDSLNRHASPFTGGSKVLQSGAISREQCRNMGYMSMIGALLILCIVMPQRVFLLGLTMIFLSSQYSAPPLVLNHAALGELTAAILMNVLLPLFAFYISKSVGLQITQSSPALNGPMLMLILPPALIKIALFIVLNMADKRPDWLANKITLPVLFGNDTCAGIHSLTMLIAYTSALFLFFVRRDVTWSSTVFVLSTGVPAIQIVRKLNTKHRPYQLTEHAPLPIVAIFLESFMREWYNHGFDVLYPFSLHFQMRCIPLYPWIYNVLLGKSPPPILFNEERPMTVNEMKETDRIIIVGGGIGGMVTALCLEHLNIPYVLVEMNGPGWVDTGADLALWPSSIKILKELGVEPRLWSENSYVVYMTKISEDQRGQEHHDVMKQIDMEEVVHGTGESFRLVGRAAIMGSLKRLHAAITRAGSIVYNARAIHIEQTEDRVRVEIKENTGDGSVTRELIGRLVIGADGVNSLCRRIINADQTSHSAMRYSGEVCYRGVSRISRDPTDQVSCNGCDQLKKQQISQLYLRDEGQKPNSMTILHGDGFRASWGIIDGISTRGYWWIKIKSETPDTRIMASTTDISKWPHPFPALYEDTEADKIYVHAICDQLPTNRWCSERMALIGDSAHPITPNMGQGANLAVEDAFTLCVLLGLHYWNHPRDGHQEAFYQYYHARSPHTRRVGAESYKQSKMGQWTSPLMVKLREAILRYLPASFLQAQLKRTNLWRVQSWIDDFNMMQH
ncbi:hypothetical protein PROFUN_10845 [Planoprotostelium fungivorum]|uniref:FAD-binding domain-containing protein n=1 Tax=Planoprotostelium fungivorum TaxID=1890364 RepID=A0A2P6NCS8_9EUKA|nr:hypothetical protein PROFUN_10845 [Planoprotostelium fungivorum]